MTASSEVVFGTFTCMYTAAESVMPKTRAGKRGSKGGEWKEARSRLGLGDASRRRLGALMKAAACSVHPCASESDNGLPETDAAAAQRENESPLAWKVRSALQGPRRGGSPNNALQRLGIHGSQTASYSQGLGRGTAVESI